MFEHACNDTTIRIFEKNLLNESKNVRNIFKNCSINETFNFNTYTNEIMIFPGIFVRIFDESFGSKARFTSDAYSNLYKLRFGKRLLNGRLF